MKTILVTGGNRGIGLAIVTELAKDNNQKVLLACRDLEKGQLIAKGLGSNVDVVALDLTQIQGLRKNIEDIQAKYQVDVLINNAGVLINGSILECDQQAIEHSLQVNTLAPLQLIRSFLPGMIQRNFGRIVNMSSGWGSFNEGLTGPFSYSFTKAALNAITLIGSQSLPSNVKINSMCPGWVKTDMGGPEAPRTPAQGAETAVWLANLPEDGPNGEFFRDKKRIDW